MLDELLDIVGLVDFMNDDDIDAGYNEWNDDISNYEDKHAEDIAFSEPTVAMNIIYTVAYFFFSLCMVAPPNEFVSAGLTIQSIFSSFIGSEDMNFIYYHLRRTCVTLIVHSLLPLGYCVGVAYIDPHYRLFAPLILCHWSFIRFMAVVVACAAIITACFWSIKNWKNHPIARQLSLHAQPGSSWTSVASAINIEFRRIDKFTTGKLGKRLIATDSWIMLTSTYKIYVAHQNDIHLNIEKCENHSLSYETSTVSQILNITVNSIRKGVASFLIRLNSLELNDLKDKLSAPIRNAKQIVIHQSLSEMFLEEFRAHVRRNSSIKKGENVEFEPCIGCMQKEANIKLDKACDDSNVGECQICHCRPMWCLECMSKWFASRQHQNAPDTWLASRAPCPTCRAKFCILDVKPII